MTKEITKKTQLGLAAATIAVVGYISGSDNTVVIQQPIPAQQIAAQSNANALEESLQKGFAIIEDETLTQEEKDSKISIANMKRWQSMCEELGVNIPECSKQL